MELHDSPNPQQMPTPPPPRGVQFNTLALLAILTVASLILAAYFGIGRAFGIETTQILFNGLGQAAYYAPQALVWIAGIAFALQSRRLPRSVARLVVVAFSGMLFTALLGGLGQMVLIQMLSSGMLGSNISMWFLAYGISLSLIHAFWWVLILMAIFRGRSAATDVTTQESR